MGTRFFLGGTHADLDTIMTIFLLTWWLAYAFNTTGQWKRNYP